MKFWTRQLSRAQTAAKNQQIFKYDQVSDTCFQVQLQEKKQVVISKQLLSGMVRNYLQLQRYE